MGRIQPIYTYLYWVMIHLLGTMDIPAGFWSLFLQEVFCRIMLTCDLNPPENERMSPRKGPFQQEKIIFQPVISLRGCVSFRGIIFLSRKIKLDA